MAADSKGGAEIESHQLIRFSWNLPLLSDHFSYTLSPGWGMLSASFLMTSIYEYVGGRALAIDCF